MSSMCVFGSVRISRIVAARSSEAQVSVIRMGLPFHSPSLSVPRIGEPNASGGEPFDLAGAEIFDQYVGLRLSAKKLRDDRGVGTSGTDSGETPWASLGHARDLHTRLRIESLCRRGKSKITISNTERLPGGFYFSAVAGVQDDAFSSPLSGVQTQTVLFKPDSAGTVAGDEFDPYERSCGFRRGRSPFTFMTRLAVKGFAAWPRRRS